VSDASQTGDAPRVSDAAVEAKTGKTWQERFALPAPAGPRSEVAQTCSPKSAALGSEEEPHS
jgi:hypothetical protein